MSYHIQFRCTVVGRKIKGKRVLPPRQSSGTKASTFAPRPEHLNSRSASTAGAPRRPERLDGRSASIAGAPQLPEQHQT
ncbi:hypothetical protein DEO72_LG10g2373 [Vigna unguiculata]|uniref:Uncharacterized protein n=1 Tax=Vigna unguiculata TaxID=3917 RepID=A0A4D6NB71_VIGUN|nr:hypothetical protein DEO72_LG10g2373 [Vigna unguiculata]